MSVAPVIAETWRITPFRLSGIAYSVYLSLLSGDCNVLGTFLNLNLINRNRTAYSLFLSLLSGDCNVLGTFLNLNLVNGNTHTVVCSVCGVYFMKNS